MPELGICVLAKEL